MSDEPKLLNASTAANRFHPSVYITMIRGVLREMEGTDGFLLFHCHPEDAETSGIPSELFVVDPAKGRMSVRIDCSEIELENDHFILHGCRIEYMSVYGFAVGNEPLVFVLADPVAPEPYAVRSMKDFYNNRRERSDAILESINSVTETGVGTDKKASKKVDLRLIHCNDTVH